MRDLAVELDGLGILTGDSVVDSNIRRLFLRSRAGMASYGCTMGGALHSTEEWIDHAIEEALDFANYLQRLKTDVCTLNRTIEQVMRENETLTSRRRSAERERYEMQLELKGIGERI